MSKPWSAMPQAFFELAKAATESEEQVVPEIAKGFAAEVDKQGSKYHLRGSKGNRVTLSSKIRLFPSAGVATVKGDPPGFWRIVTDGSAAHIISSRFSRSGERRKGTQRGVLRRFENDETFGDTKPLNLGSIGFRQWAHHRGHSGFGDPWRKALDQTDTIVTDAHNKVTKKLLLDAWHS